MKEITEQYVRGYALKCGVENPSAEDIAAVLKVMNKYAERWWESDDEVSLAYHQVRERILIIPLQVYHDGIRKICDRPIYQHDLFGQFPEFIQEVEEGMKRLNQGWKVSEEGKEALVERSTSRLEKFVEECGKNVLKVELPESEGDG